MPASLIVVWRPFYIELPSFAAIDVITAVMFPFTPLSWASRCVAEAVQVHRLRSPAGEDAPVGLSGPHAVAMGDITSNRPGNEAVMEVKGTAAACGG